MDVEPSAEPDRLLVGTDVGPSAGPDRLLVGRVIGLLLDIVASSLWA